MAPSRLLRALIAALLLAGATPAAAEERGFDHYLLALTWMPSFCEFEGDAREDSRCAPDSGHGWTVHGLWPQRTGGSWPEYCDTAHRNPSRRETAAQVDLYGASGSAGHQWNKHGRCTGLSAADYFALTRAAAGRLTLPQVFDALDQTIVLSPDVVEAAFIEANPGLTYTMMLTTCRQDAIVELRLCLTRDLRPRPCDNALILRGCSLDAARMPGLR
ncbi:ribonuclease T [Pararhodobacter sp. SW119]|uniref:ribonuclease T2 family protein n=1 Tax=Pararhodobacter sp. SW119 TaxID=2780075 RepID=UPI001ADEC419|nr:ribonuclease T [Pararhodobacter sp. SW119]